MNRSVSYFVFISCLMALTPLYAGTQTLTTYYPAPQGNYKNMTVNNLFTLASGPVCTGPTAGNIVTIVDAGGSLEFCDSTGGPYRLTSDNLWTGNGTYLYPTVPGQNVAVGSASSPTHKFEVTGTFGVTGNTTLTGTAAVSGATTLSSTLGVTGATTLSSTLGVTGATTLSNTLNVSGATTLGPNSGSALTTVNGTATVTGLSTLTGGATVSGTLKVNNGTAITVCTAGSNCGTLKVVRSNSDGNYYAVYGP